MSPEPAAPAQSPQQQRKETLTSVGLFLATLASVYLVFGFLWTGGNPLQEAESATKAAAFALTLMAILLAHEMGHFIVARRHGFSLSLPYFIPFPAAFGTFGAVIRLRSLPRDRTGLLEMGAAGPLAGFVVSAIAIAVGLPGTKPAEPPPLPLEPIEPVPLPDALSILQPLWEHLFPVVPEGHVEVLIFANPLLMDLLGLLILGAPPGRFDELTPMALAGWVGCLLTAMNLLPIGQLDGGHILSGIWPKGAPRLSKLLLGLAIAAGVLWTPWAVWGLMLFFFRGYKNLAVPEQPPLTPRAKLIAALIVLTFILSFMPIPIEMDTMAGVPQ